MVIVLKSNPSNNKESFKHRKINNKLSEQVLEKNSTQQIDQTSPSLQTNQKPSSEEHQLLPQKDILVEVDEEYYPILGKKILDHYREKNRKRQEDGYIHIFEVSSCLRQSLIYQQYPEDITDLTIHDTKNFDHGLKSETVLVDVLESQKDPSVSTEYQYDIDFSGISGHPDYIENDWVFELKSVNKFKPLILSDDSVKGYIRQIVYYMILMDIEKGRIIVGYNMPFFPEFIKFDDVDGERLYKLRFHKDTGQFPYFLVKLNIPLNAPIREKVKSGLLNVVKPLYQEGDISKIPRLDGAIEGSNWRCSNYCKVYNICMKLPDEQHDIDIRNILLNKHIDEQVDRKRAYGKRKDRDVVID